MEAPQLPQSTLDKKLRRSGDKVSKPSALPQTDKAHPGLRVVESELHPASSDLDLPVLRELHTHCNYFCSKKLDEIVIVMTHNSLATPGDVFSPNQNNGLETQFDDGVRGFNFDLYMDDSNNVFTHHGLISDWNYNPEDQIKGLVSKIRSNPTEFVVIQLQDAMNRAGRDKLIGWLGDSLIKNFDVNRNLGYYIHKKQQILMVTDRTNNVDESKGMHNTYSLVTENNYGWQGFSEICRLTGPDFNYRRGPTSGRSLKLMNSFCSTTGATGDMIGSGVANSKNVILDNARQFKKQCYAYNKVNVIMVDYYEIGDPFGAQAEMRTDGFFNDDNHCTSIFLHAPGGDWSSAHPDAILNYQTWDGTHWTAKVVGNRFLHAPNGDWARAHSDTILNYCSWDGTNWTVRMEGDKFLLAPEGDWTKARSVPYIKYKTWNGGHWTAKLNTIHLVDSSRDRCRGGQMVKVEGKSGELWSVAEGDVKFFDAGEMRSGGITWYCGGTSERFDISTWSVLEVGRDGDGEIYWGGYCRCS